MKELKITSNWYKQALEAQEWLKTMPQRILKAERYIVENDLNIDIYQIHGDIGIKHDPKISKKHLINLTNILKHESTKD